MLLKHLECNKRRTKLQTDKQQEQAGIKTKANLASHGLTVTELNWCNHRLEVRRKQREGCGSDEYFINNKVQREAFTDTYDS